MIASSTTYHPFGMPLKSRALQTYRCGFNGMEKDPEITGQQGSHLDFGARIYDSRIGRWLALDPLAAKFPDYSPYNFTLNSPILFVDPDGEEPVKEFVGTSSDFSAILNNSPRRVGRFKGEAASNYLLSLGNTKFNWKKMKPDPAQTGYFNNKEGRYIYTETGGWIDMTHFMFYAGKAYEYKLKGAKKPVNMAIKDGYYQETSDWVAAPHSAFSYEDLPSDKFGADFAANYFDADSELTFAEQLQSYLDNELGATEPENAPNFDELPKTDASTVDSPPTEGNMTTIPLFINNEEGKDE
ncbi:MAG: RHS repeat domain-containing protein [Bacteroidales bacterium]